MSKRKDIPLVKFLASLPASIKTSPGKLQSKLQAHFASRTGYLEKSARYGFEVAPGEFRIFDERAFIRELGVRGLHHCESLIKKLPHDAKTRETKKEIEERRKSFLNDTLSLIRETRTVDFIGELSGYPAGFYEDINGYRLLISRTVQIPAPRRGDYKFCELFARTLFPGIQCDTIKTIIKYARKNREAGPPFDPIQILIIAGGVEHGKTLFAQEILGTTLGGFADATVHFTTDNRFNDDIAKAGVALLDDQNFPARLNPQSFFDRLRKYSATTIRRVESKFGTTIHVPLFQMIVLLANTEEHNLDWFPDISADIADKLQLIKSASAKDILPTGRNQRAEIRKKFRAQLPAWLWHVDNEYVPPAEILTEGRYGVKPFHHPDLKNENYAARQRRELIEAVTKFARNQKDQEFYGSAFELRSEFESSGDPGLIKYAERSIKSASGLAKALVKIAESIPDQIIVVSNPDSHVDSNLYRLLSPEKAKAVKEGIAAQPKTNIIEAKTNP